MTLILASKLFSSVAVSFISSFILIISFSCIYSINRIIWSFRVLSFSGIYVVILDVIVVTVSFITSFILINSFNCIQSTELFNYLISVDVFFKCFLFITAWMFECKQNVLNTEPSLHKAIFFLFLLCHSLYTLLSLTFMHFSILKKWMLSLPKAILWLELPSTLTSSTLSKLTPDLYNNIVFYNFTETLQSRNWKGQLCATKCMRNFVLATGKRDFYLGN